MCLLVKSGSPYMSVFIQERTMHVCTLFLKSLINLEKVFALIVNHKQRVKSEEHLVMRNNKYEPANEILVLNALLRKRTPLRMLVYTNIGFR